jgi:hypothetical protein
VQFATVRQGGLCSQCGRGKRRNTARQSGGIGQRLPFGGCSGKAAGKRVTRSGRIDTLDSQLWRGMRAECRPKAEASGDAFLDTLKAICAHIREAVSA